MKIVRNTRRKRSKFFTNTHARTHHHDVIKCLVYAIFDSVSFIWILLCMIRIRWMIYVKIFQTSGDNRTSATWITTTTEKTLYRFFPFVIMLKCWQNLNCLFFLFLCTLLTLCGSLYAIEPTKHFENLYLIENAYYSYYCWFGCFEMTFDKAGVCVCVCLCFACCHIFVSRVTLPLNWIHWWSMIPLNACA